VFVLFLGILPNLFGGKYNIETVNVFWCEYCGKKITTNDLSLLKYYVRPQIQRKVPFLDFESNKKQSSEFFKKQIFFKCDKCGRVLKEVSNNDEANQNN
jgi:hypothetical protein